MKIMRYRIRVVALILICAILAVLLWIIEASWFQNTPPEENLPVTLSSPDLGSGPVWDQDHGTTVPADSAEIITESTPSPEPLFDTSGL